MTYVLHIPARSDAPVACDMRGATDTPAERLADYARLFAGALLRSERHAGSVVFHFRASPGTRELIDDLSRREAVCCPFLEYRVENDVDSLVWTISSPVAGDERAAADAILDGFHRVATQTR